MKNDLKNNYHLIDSNVLMYASDSESIFHEEAKQVLSACLGGGIKGVISHQNLLELIKVLIKYYKKSLQFALNTAGIYSREFSLQIISPLSTTYTLFDRFLSQSEQADIFDVYLAATAIDNGIDNIITNNPKDFIGIRELKVLSLKDTVKVLKAVTPKGSEES